MRLSDDFQLRLFLLPHVIVTGQMSSQTGLGARQVVSV